jgi:hypothetical protein
MEARFPEVEGRSLEDEVVTLPSGLEGELNLLAVAFHRTHQRDVDTWIPLFRRLEGEVEGLAGYEIPTISGGWKPVRKFIDGGMKAAIPDPLTRSRTVTVYGDVGRVTDALRLPDRDEIAVLLCNRAGEVLWITTGPLRGEPPAELFEALGVTE